MLVTLCEWTQLITGYGGRARWDHDFDVIAVRRDHFVGGGAVIRAVRYRRPRSNGTVATPHILFAEKPAYEIGGVFRAKFLHDVRTVEFDGARTDAERARGFFTGSAYDLSQRHAFTRRQ
jgi:hypothetical protein